MEDSVIVLAEITEKLAGDRIQTRAVVQ